MSTRAVPKKKYPNAPAWMSPRSRSFCAGWSSGAVLCAQNPPEDARRHVVSLAPEATQDIRQAREAAAAVNARAVAGLSDHDIAVLRRCLTTMEGNLQ